MSDINQTQTDAPEPANLRFLRRLVTVLTLTMIFGLLAIFVVIVMRFSSASTPSAPLPDAITLPDGKTAATFTQGSNWYAIVTTDDEILIYDRQNNSLRQRVQINP